MADDRLARHRVERDDISSWPAVYHLSEVGVWIVQGDYARTDAAWRVLKTCCPLLVVSVVVVLAMRVRFQPGPSLAVGFVLFLVVAVILLRGANMRKLTQGRIFVHLDPSTIHFFDAAGIPKYLDRWGNDGAVEISFRVTMPDEAVAVAGDRRAFHIKKTSYARARDVRITYGEQEFIVATMLTLEEATKASGMLNWVIRQPRLPQPQRMASHKADVSRIQRLE